jgi:hypothetical protein
VLLALTAALLVSVPSVVVAPAAGEVLQPPQAPGIWGTAISPDVAAILLVAAGLLLIAAIIGVVLATRAQRRREGPIGKDRATPASLDEFAIAHWIEESRRFLNLWQERIEHLDELRGRLTAMAQEIGHLRAQVSQSDELRAENLRLSQESEALLLERDQLRAVLTRIGELIQRASEARAGRPGGDAAPKGGP